MMPCSLFIQTAYLLRHSAAWLMTQNNMALHQYGQPLQCMIPTTCVAMNSVLSLGCKDDLDLGHFAAGINCLLWYMPPTVLMQEDDVQLCYSGSANHV